MKRRLTAIEIAEGALLADIGVIFQLIAIYLPVGGIFFRLLIPTTITIVVLRRSVYAGIMAYLVSMFTAGLISGYNSVGAMMLQAGAGLFLGITMKYRIRDSLLVLIGAAGSALWLYGISILLPFIFGAPLDTIIIPFRRGFAQVISLFDFIAPQIGMYGVWRQGIYPFMNAIATWAFTYWWFSLYIVYFCAFIPIVIIVYYVTNLFIRLLGYHVRPFPSGRLHRLMNWIVRKILKVGMRMGIGKYGVSRSLVREYRRRSIEKGADV
ncbi:MAG: YybS family protein [Chloroflexota bacterium]|nr:YybS family protein [Chloroflexota bacterium]